MERDLRQTPLYHEIEAQFLAGMSPAFGRISDAADLAPSPDGLVLACTGSKMHRLEGVPETRICLVTLATGTLEEITSGPNDDLMPRFSPDGRFLAFLSDRKQQGLHQLYLLQRDRLGEAQATPWIEGTVEYLAWSPDGRSILLGVAGPGADIGDAHGAGTTPQRADNLPSWMPSVDSGATENKWRRLWRYDCVTGTSTLLSPAGLNVWEAAWAGNDRVQAIVSQAPSEGAWYTAQLVTLDVATGRETPVYASPRQIGVPAASPSGQYLAVVQAVCSDRGLVAGDLMLFDGKHATPRQIDTRGVDVTHLVWRDEAHLFFAGQRGLMTVYGDLDPASGVARELWSTAETSGSHAHEAAILPDGAFAMVLHSYTRYPEFLVVRDGVPALVLSLAHAGSDYQIQIGGSLEAVTWTAPDGLEIEGLLARPAGPGPFPLVVHVHGGPVWGYRNRWSLGESLRPLVSRGYAVLHPNPRGSTGRGQPFAGAVYGEMGGADVDDLLSGVDALIDRGIADPARLGVMGTSYGGFMSSLLIGRTDRFGAAISMSPVNEWRSMHFTTYFPDFDVLFLQDDPYHTGGQYDTRSPLMYARNVHTPTLHMAGGRDEATPASQAIAFHHALLENGVESVLVLYPEEGHGVRRYPAIIDWCTRIVDWFERFIPPNPQTV